MDIVPGGSTRDIPAVPVAINLLRHMNKLCLFLLSHITERE